MNLIKFSFMAFVFLVSFSCLSVAQGIIGVSPANFKYEDVLRGGYAERNFYISFSGEDPIQISVEPGGEIAKWINLATNFSVVSTNNPFILTAAVEPPSDMPNGNYTGYLRIRTSPIDGTNKIGHATGNIIAALDVEISVSVTDREIFKCTSGSFQAISAERGDDLIFKADVLNKGNVRIKPKFLIDIWDQDQISIVKSLNFIGLEVLPTKQGSFVFKTQTNDMDVGQYWTEMSSLDCFDSSLLTLDVFEPGALKSQGVFKELLAPYEIFAGETSTTTVIFENTGEKDVDAQFRGQITLDNKIFQVLEGERTNVEVGSLSNSTFYFTPKKAGRYIISGRFFYDNKRTFELSKTVFVISNPFSLKTALLILLYLVIAVIVFYFYRRIRKEIKRYNRLG